MWKNKEKARICFLLFLIVFSFSLLFFFFGLKTKAIAVSRTDSEDFNRGNIREAIIRILNFVLNQNQEEGKEEKEEKRESQKNNLQVQKKMETKTQESQKKEFFTPPEKIKAVYLTSWSAASKSKINYIIDLAKKTEINAVVIDIKDYSGYVGYELNSEIASKPKEYGAERIRIRDIDKLIENLHKQGIYVIGRITVFQDPVLAYARPDLAIYNKLFFKEKNNTFSSLFSSFFFWLDNLKLAWVDPASPEVWDYNISIAKDALSRGFDEINFDYVRFPSDGNLRNMGFPFWDGETPRHLIVKEFFKKMRENLPNAVLSVDLFGLSTVNRDDLGVGQVIEDAYEYFDYICPMVYPSHYASGFLGYNKPAQYPYQVVFYSMKNAYERLKFFYENKKNFLDSEKEKNLGENQPKLRRSYLRPWLQDFSLAVKYDEGMVRAEIQGVIDALPENEYKGFMLWSPANIYTKEALELEMENK